MRKREVARQAAGITRSWVVDKVRRTRPSSADEIPVGADALTTEWLTSVLCQRVPGAEVTSFTIPGGSSGTSERAALRVTYNDAGQDAGLPSELFTKASRSLRQRLLMGAGDMLVGESAFYFTYRSGLEIEAPRGYWGAGDPATGRSFLLLEDIAATKGATFFDGRQPLARRQVEDILANMAVYHGVWWESPGLATLKSTADHFGNIGGIIDFGTRCGVGLERSKAIIPAGFERKADRLWEGTRKSLDLQPAQEFTLLHGDCHAGQTYETSSGAMGLTDWQLTMRGSWAFDVAYFIGSACAPEDRRAWEEDLLRDYLEKLKAAGGRPPGFAEAMLAYRRSFFYPCIGWAAIIGRAWYQPEMQPREVMDAILNRLAYAVEDLDSFDAIGV